MTRADHQRAYLAALDKAHMQLDELLATYQQLQLRKERLEEAAEALKILFKSEKQGSAGNQKLADSSVEPRDPGTCSLSN